MEDNNVNEVAPGKPVKKPLFWLTISRITRIGSAVLLILGGNVDLIIGFAIFALSGIGDPPTSEMKRQNMQFGMTLFMGSIILFSLHLTAGICWIMKKGWAFWTGFVLSIAHIIGIYVLVKYFSFDAYIAFVLRLLLKGWWVAVLLFTLTILINIFGHRVNILSILDRENP